MIACGVSPDAIELTEGELDSTDRALESAAPNDLILIFGAGMARVWKRIIYFKPSRALADEDADAPLPDAEAIDVPDGYELVRDHRGARLVLRS